MRQVATIPDERAAKRLADHLLTVGITTRVDPSPGGWIVWVHREEKVEGARREVEEFLANPADPRYADAPKAAEAARRAAAKQEKAHLRNTINLEGRLNVPSARRCPVTYTLIGLSIAVAILTNLGGNREAMRPLLLSPPVVTVEQTPFPIYIDEEERPGDVRTFTLPTRQLRSSGLEDVKRGQVWRLVTPMLLHFSYLHIIFNMMWLYQLGGLIELRKGRLAMAALVLVSAAISNLGEYFWHIYRNGPLDPIVFGGMSGVVYALFGYCWMKSDYDHEADMKMPSNTIVWMIGWLVLCMTGAVGPIANAAHLVGLVVGMLIGLAPHVLAGRR